jgi:hypothetical protein
MCKEYFDAHPDRIVKHGKIVIKKELRRNINE